MLNADSVGRKSYVELALLETESLQQALVKPESQQQQRIGLISLTLDEILLPIEHVIPHLADHLARGLFNDRREVHLVSISVVPDQMCCRKKCEHGQGEIEYWGQFQRLFR